MDGSPGFDPGGGRNAGFVNGRGAEYVLITGLIFAPAPAAVTQAPAVIEAEISQLQSEMKCKFNLGY